MVSFPGSLDALANPSGSDTVAGVPHAAQHGTANDILEALEAKVGIGASTPTASTVLTGTGTGTSAWVAVVEASRSVVSKTANYTATDADDTIDVDTSGGDVTISLPTAVGREGQRFDISKTTADANTVIIDPSGAQTINGAATLVLSTQYTSYTLESDDANWRIR